MDQTKNDSASYSKREAELIRLIAHSKKKRVTLDYLCDKYPTGKKFLKKPDNLRSSIASSMRHIEWKSHAAGEPVIRKVSGRGRGNKAEYEVLEGAKKVTAKLKKKGTLSTQTPGRAQR